MSRSLVGIIVGLELLLPQLAHAHLICRIGNLGGMPWAVVTTPGKRSEGMSLLTEGVSLLAKGKRLEGLEFYQLSSEKQSGSAMLVGCPSLTNHHVP